MLKEYLQLCAKEELWNKVLVFHCRDQYLPMEASDLCLQILKDKIPSFDKDIMEIDRYCYIVGWYKAQ